MALPQGTDKRLIDVAEAESGSKKMILHFSQCNGIAPRECAPLCVL